MAFNLDRFKEKLLEEPAVVPIEKAPPAERRKSIISEVAANLGHHKKITITQEMIDLGLMPVLQEMINTFDMRAKMSHLLNKDDDDYTNPYNIESEWKFEDCLGN